LKHFSKPILFHLRVSLAVSLEVYSVLKFIYNLIDHIFVRFDISIQNDLSLFPHNFLRDNCGSRLDDPTSKKPPRLARPIRDLEES